jgi:hypothetical protein
MLKTVAKAKSEIKLPMFPEDLSFQFFENTIALNEDSQEAQSQIAFCK